MRTCESPQCRGNEFISRDGLCKSCEMFSVVAQDGRSCIKPDCAGREIIQKDGTCEECPSYTKPDAEKLSCYTEQCENERDSIGPDGECDPYDDTCEKKLAKVEKEASQCAQSVKEMNTKY